MDEYTNPLIHHPLFQHQKQTLFSPTDTAPNIHNNNNNNNTPHVSNKGTVDSTCTTSTSGQRPTSPGVVFSEEGLILPRKLVNPCLESKERQDLHRELLFNQKTGKNVLDQKTELARALEQRELSKRNKAREAEKLVRKSSFERKLDEQALKIIGAEHEEKVEKNTPEFFKIHAKICEKRQQVA